MRALGISCAELAITNHHTIDSYTLGTLDSPSSYTLGRHAMLK